VSGDWVADAAALAAAGEPFAVVTVAEVTGHAPREAGAAMLVTPDREVGTVGGGNLEHTGVLAAREALAARRPEPRLVTVRLDPGGGEHGVQCCGGRVVLLVHPVLPDRPTVAVVGAGHVGWALVDVLRPLPVAVELVDSRADRLALRPGRVPGQVATVRARHLPAPEAVVAGLPPGALLVVLTHDHAEDLAVLDVALRRHTEHSDLGFVGLIGSRTKWAHFRRRLLAAGHDESALALVTTPIGVPGVRSKEPAAVAIATAAQLLTRLPGAPDEHDTDGEEPELRPRDGEPGQGGPPGGRAARRPGWRGGVDHRPPRAAGRPRGRPRLRRRTAPAAQRITARPPTRVAPPIRSPRSSAAHPRLSTGCTSCTWLTWAIGPSASPRYQAKKPRNMLTTPR
jgi:xanthine dehydrogenase accessory factor